MTGFEQETLDIRTSNGLDDLLLEPLRMTTSDGRRWKAPAGTTTDGLSSLRCFWWIPWLAPAGNREWFCAVMHDAAYRDFLEVLTGDGYVKASLSRVESDWLILDALILQGVSKLRAYIIYAALRMFGGGAFRKDRLKK